MKKTYFFLALLIASHICASSSSSSSSSSTSNPIKKFLFRFKSHASESTPGVYIISPDEYSIATDGSLLSYHTKFYNKPQLRTKKKRHLLTCKTRTVTESITQKEIGLCNVANIFLELKATFIPSGIKNGVSVHTSCDCYFGFGVPCVSITNETTNETAYLKFGSNTFLGWRDVAGKTQRENLSPQEAKKLFDTLLLRHTAESKK